MGKGRPFDVYVIAKRLDNMFALGTERLQSHQNTKIGIDLASRIAQQGEKTHSIFSSGFRKAGVSQKRIAYEQAKNSREFAAEGLQVEFEQYKYDFANAVEKYRSDKKNLELSEKVVRVTNSKYVEGLASSLELTQVNNQYLQALTNYTSSMVEVLNAKIKIDQLMNKL